MLKAEKRKIANVVLLLVLLSSLLIGCSKVPLVGGLFKKKEPTPSIYPEDTSLPPPPDADISDTQGEVSQLPLEGIEGTTPPATDLGIPQPEPIRVEPDQMVSDLQTVHFGFDRAELSEEARAVLDSNYEWLREHPGVHVLIEGHCDERGTVEYNLNLGQRRADSVREYLISKDLDAATLHTISYGEERPLDEGHNESAWTKNRRVQFLVY